MTTKPKQQNPERSKKDAFDILDKRVKIYRTASKVWQMQMWIREEGKYVRESLHTEDREIAMKKAEERYIFYRAKILQNEKVFSITLDELRNRYLKHIQSQVDSRQLSKGRQTTRVRHQILQATDSYWVALKTLHHKRFRTLSISVF